MERDLADGSVNPMVLKKQLALNLVSRLHSPAEADEAAARFEREVQRKELPSDIPTFVLRTGGEWPIIDLLLECKLATGRNDAKRLIEGGTILYDGVKVTDPRALIAVQAGAVVRGRRRQYVRLALQD